MKRIGLLLVLVLAACSDSPQAVYTRCQDEVRERLLSPASAVFPSISDDDVDVDVSEHEAYVSGHVDSQNEFGAMLRSSFTCRFNKRDGEWDLVGSPSIYPSNP